MASLDQGLIDEKEVKAEIENSGWGISLDLEGTANMRFKNIDGNLYVIYENSVYYRKEGSFYCLSCNKKAQDGLLIHKLDPLAKDLFSVDSLYLPLCSCSEHPINSEP